ncbi:MAG TPA: hypothetical protein VGA36_09835 [Nitriliruptorales bacterium]
MISDVRRRLVASGAAAGLLVAVLGAPGWADTTVEHRVILVDRPSSVYGDPPLVAFDDEQLARLWTHVGYDIPEGVRTWAPLPAIPPPTVDFDRDMVVFVFAALGVSGVQLHGEMVVIELGTGPPIPGTEVPSHTHEAGGDDKPVIVVERAGLPEPPFRLVVRHGDTGQVLHDVMVPPEPELPPKDVDVRASPAAVAVAGDGGRAGWTFLALVAAVVVAGGGWWWLRTVVAGRGPRPTKDPT